jgi:uncharacterized protein DUF5714/predicted metal-binding protein DUF2284
MVCGSSLSYLYQAQDVTCSYCGKVEQGHIRCPSGHYICDLCHNRDAMTIIADSARTTTLKDPFEISELMMSYPGLPMLGCQHAYIAGGAFMAALKNEGSRGITNNDLDEVFKRTEKQAHGGYCGLSGVCGIAPAVGACFSVLTGAKCGADEAQRATMEAVTRVSRVITDLTGPSCCKAYVWSALDVAVAYTRESLGIVLPSHKVKIACSYTHKHPHGCRENNCPYFAGTATTRSAAVSANEAVVSSGVVQVLIRKHGEDTMEQLLKRALELGAEQAKVISTDTVVVDEWVRWKCRYGCAFYEKDGCHPPIAPDTESTRKVMREYSKAVLLKGSKGKLLTEVAGRLEGEAYHRGFYKAFALTALAIGGGSGAT